MHRYRESHTQRRQADELLNVLASGRIRIGAETLRVWRGEHFAPDDLLGYLAGRTTHADFFAAMEPRERRYALGAMQLRFETFALNPETITQIPRSRYPQAADCEDAAVEHDSWRIAVSEALVANLVANSGRRGD